MAGVTSDAVGPHPADWEADVLLGDGSTAHLRPITPDDAERLVAFYARVSPESKYFRFFAPYPVLSDKDVRRFTTVDHHDRVALILLVGEDMIAVGRYDKINDTDAEVAFLVQDGVQGRGVAPILLEHLAEAARESGISRFVAEVLPENRRMAQVFAAAGYHISREFDDGMLMVEFPILPTDTSIEVMLRRERRAEARSVRRLLHPERIAVVGMADLVQSLVSSILAGGYHGHVTAVPLDDGEVQGVPVASSVMEMDGLDVMIVALPLERLPEAVRRAAAQQAFGMVVLHSGEYGGETNREVVMLARSHGLRAVGPDALGMINTDPEVSLNASPAPMPRQGNVGIFTQSSSVGVTLLANSLHRHLGVSTFISSGIRADVTNNDVLHYWLEDPATEVCMLSMDRIGNPRKFFRIARSVAAQKPVILFSPGRSDRDSYSPSAQHLTKAPPEAVDAVFRQAGLIVCERRAEMFDVAQILARQPRPAGNRLHAITNAPAMARHIRRMARRVGLQATTEVVASRADAATYARDARAALVNPDVDMVLVNVIDVFNDTAQSAYQALAEIAPDTEKPLVGVFTDFTDVQQSISGPDGRGQLPTFTGYADALQALGQVARYTDWLDRQVDDSEDPDITFHRRRAHALIEHDLAEHPAGRIMPDEYSQQLLACVGIDVLPRYRVDTAEEAVAAAEAAGWNVVLKASDHAVRGLPDRASVFRNLDTAAEVTEAWADLGEVVRGMRISGSEENAQRAAAPVIQKMSPPGISLEVRTREDLAFGPMISVGLAGLASEMLGDVSWRVPPLSRSEARRMLADLRVAPTLFGHGGAPGIDIDAVCDLLVRVGTLADRLPQLAEIALNPCIAGPSGVHVAGAEVRVAAGVDQRDALSRSLN